jgi:DNA-binding protein
MTQSRGFSWDAFAVEDTAKSVVIKTTGLTVTTPLVEHEIVRHCFFREHVDSVQTKSQGFDVSKC